MVMKVPLNINFIDKILGGGIETDAITTIYGPPGIGKTNFCILAMKAVDHNRKILFIDTEGSFSVERLKQVAPEYEELLSRTIFLTPTNYSEQREAFEYLKNNIDITFGLIIVDSIASLYRIELTYQDSQQVTRELNLQMAQLTEIARKKHIPVILTNQVYSDFEDREKTRTVGGDIVKYWSRTLLELQRIRPEIRRITLIKHRSIKEGDFANYRIVQTGDRKSTRLNSSH